MGRTTALDDDLITTFGRLVEAQSHLGKQLGRSLEREAGIGHAWFEVLLRASRAGRGQLTLSALAQQVVLTTGGITKLVDRMADAGLVERVPCATDRRVTFVALTGKGDATLQQAAEVHARNLHDVFAGFTAADLSRLDELLDRLRTAELDGGAT